MIILVMDFLKQAFKIKNQSITKMSVLFETPFQFIEIKIRLQSAKPV